MALVDGDLRMAMKRKRLLRCEQKNPGLQASGNGGVSSHPTKTAIFKSDKLLYKGTTYKTVKYIIFSGLSKYI